MDDRTELIYGVVRGVDTPEPGGAEDERRLLVFSIDTRTHSAARIYGDQGQLDQLDDAELPADAAVTPYVYALAGPRAAVADAWARFEGAIRAAYEALGEQSSAEQVATAAEQRLVGLVDFTPERFADLALVELVGGSLLAYPMAAAALLPDDWEARGLFATDGPLDDGWLPVVEALLEAWLAVEAVPGRDRPWAPHDIEEALNDPLYSFGLSLEPRADLVATVAAFTRGLAERPDPWDRASLEAEYRALFARLEGSGRFRRGPDAPPLVPLEDWLDHQLVRIARLRADTPGTPLQ